MFITVFFLSLWYTPLYHISSSTWRLAFLYIYSPMDHVFFINSVLASSNVASDGILESAVTLRRTVVFMKPWHGPALFNPRAHFLWHRFLLSMKTKIRPDAALPKQAGISSHSFKLLLVWSRLSGVETKETILVTKFHTLVFFSFARIMSAKPSFLSIRLNVGSCLQSLKKKAF